MSRSTGRGRDEGHLNKRAPITCTIALLFLLAFLGSSPAHAQTYYYTGKNPATPEANDAASAIACDADAIGVIRDNTATSVFEGCNGTAWADIRAGAIATAAGSTGQVQFNSGGLLGANANFFWDNVNGRLGIGTAVPGYPLTVAGNTRIMNLVKVGPDESTLDNSAGIHGWVGSNAQIFIATTGADPGLGVESVSAAAMGVYGVAQGTTYAAAVEGDAIVTGTGGSGIGLHAFAMANGSVVANSLYGVLVDSPYFGGGASTTNDYGVYIHDQSAAGANAFNIYSDGASSKNYFAGKIGIGTASPTAPLHVNRSAPGTISSSGTTVTGTGTTFTTTFAVGDLIMSAGQTQTIATIPSDTSLTTSVAFSPVISAGAAYTRVGAVFNSGNVGVSTATPGTALDVNGGVTMEPATVTLTANNTVLATANRSYVQVTSDNTTEANRIFCFGAGTLGQILIIEWTSSTDRGEIVSHGNCGAAAGAVTASLSYTNWAPKNAETILQLMYNGTHWIQIAGSANY